MKAHFCIVICLQFLLVLGILAVEPKSLPQGSFLYLEDMIVPGGALDLAIAESEAYLDRTQKPWEFRIGKKTYNKKEIRDSFARLRSILSEPYLAERKFLFEKYFELHQIEVKKDITKVTGYYEVEIEARYYPTGEFQYPILETPKSKCYLQKTRKEILELSKEGNNIRPIVYVRLVDLHLAQLEGSAFIKMPDLSSFRIVYDSDNGKPYFSPAKSLLGICASLKPYNLSDCAKIHPNEVTNAIFSNDRYVFFKKAKNGNLGSGGIRLVPNHSVAMDSKYPLALPLILKFKPEPLNGNYQLTFVHDRGSEIVGEGRLDYYLGSGKRAEEVANSLQTEGLIYILLPRK
ncbi:MltA domain-containing protein [Leptospira sp. 96542]|nr:MltA domain-containing protein [Leptospira sp. 96542]